MKAPTSLMDIYTPPVPKHWEEIKPRVTHKMDQTKPQGGARKGPSHFRGCSSLAMPTSFSVGGGRPRYFSD